MEENAKLCPCDCPDMKTAYKLHGLTIGQYSIEVMPNKVHIVLKDTLEIAIPMRIFKQFAYWYFDPQEIEQTP